MVGQEAFGDEFGGFGEEARVAVDEEGGDPDCYGCAFGGEWELLAGAWVGDCGVEVLVFGCGDFSDGGGGWEDAECFSDYGGGVFELVDEVRIAADQVGGGLVWWKYLVEFCY